ncbi:MAG: baseplate J/gp47 family protein [Aquificota bacterium]|nr:baseplate J/gp47 family protein [Aquificota bacterium]
MSFTITDPTYYEEELIKTYETLTKRTLQPADPERLLVNLLTYALTLDAINIDLTGKQNLLAYAKGENLDKLAEFYGIKRLPPKPAVTTLRFSTDQPLGFDVVIPKGTKATADSAESSLRPLKKQESPQDSSRLKFRLSAPLRAQSETDMP